MFFLRAIERTDRVACQHGTELLDEHDDLGAAVSHLRDLGAALGRVIVFVHHLDGRVEEVARIGLDPHAATGGTPPPGTSRGSDVG